MTSNSSQSGAAMSDVMAVAVIPAIGALAGAVVFLYKQVVFLYKQIIAAKDDYAKCAEAHARAEERYNGTVHRLTDLEKRLDAAVTTGTRPTIVAQETKVAS